MPSPSGSFTSVMTMDTGPRASRVAALARLSARRTSNPSLRSMMPSSSRMDGSSSMTSIFCILRQKYDERPRRAQPL